jgi:5'-nucleotidase
MKRAQWIALAGIMLVVFMTSGCRWGNVTITILQTSDVHNHASGYGPFLDYTPRDTGDEDAVKGGYARLASLIKQIRNEQAARWIPTLVLDSGDFTMGTVYDMTVSNPIALQYFSMVGYDAVTLGNHEFDWSSAGLAKILYNGYSNGFRVPVVATNTEIPAGNSLEALKAAGVIVDTKVIEYPFGFKVGIIGLMGEDADDKAPVAAPVTFNHSYDFIQAKVDDLRENRHVQLVIALSHGGVKKDGTGEDADLASNVRGIDVIASGHFHTATAEALVPDGTRTIIFSPGEYGECLSRLDITYNIFLRKVVDHRFTLIPVDDTVQGDPEVKALVDACNVGIDAAIAPLGVALSSPVSKTSFPLELASVEESGFGNLAADAVRAAASTFAPLNDGSPCDVSVVASGVIGTTSTPARRAS